MVVEWDGGTLLQAEYADRHLVILMYVCVCQPRMPASCKVSGIVGSHFFVISAVCMGLGLNDTCSCWPHLTIHQTSLFALFAQLHSAWQNCERFRLMM